MDLGLAGKVILVTGGAKNVGREIARTLAAEGARLAITYLSSKQEAKITADQARAAGAADVLTFRNDVTDYAAVQALVAEIGGRLGPIDVLINNAGVGRFGRFLESAPADWRPVIETDLYGVMNCTHAVLPSMVERRSGRIITIIGDSGRVGESGLATTAAARGGGVAFSKSVAKEVGRFGVTVNAVSLGVLKGEGLDHLWDPASEERVTQMYALRRLGTPRDPAGLVALLASEWAGWITGQTISVSGGFSMV
ncbi:MAG TPA: SDR family oxidoreductase [Dehalococcoidia bacterium]|nr:SDR family oxidoreductase [Dehalococcoidia bacterium]